MRWRRREDPKDPRETSAHQAIDKLLFPDCWLSTEGPRREVRCLGRLDADREAAIGIWLWFTGTDAVTDLTPTERRALRSATRVEALDTGTGPTLPRLVRHIGQQQAQLEADRWGVWSVPIDELESVLSTALTRLARAGHRHLIVA